mmetsp:Transcript_1937/g.7472  ORF Transcript_1937/g.7472 Transcript_1937/m.7472 type:complete len:315 (+) Transcript_1937:122-1066(+)
MEDLLGARRGRDGEGRRRRRHGVPVDGRHGAEDVAAIGRDADGARGWIEVGYFGELRVIRDPEELGALVSDEGRGDGLGGVSVERAVQRVDGLKFRVREHQTEHLRIRADVLDARGPRDDDGAALHGPGEGDGDGRRAARLRDRAQLPTRGDGVLAAPLCCGHEPLRAERAVRHVLHAARRAERAHLAILVKRVHPVLHHVRDHRAIVLLGVLREELAQVADADVRDADGADEPVGEGLSGRVVRVEPRALDALLPAGAAEPVPAARVVQQEHVDVAPEAARRVLDRRAARVIPVVARVQFGDDDRRGAVARVL